MLHLYPIKRKQFRLERKYASLTLLLQRKSNNKIIHNLSKGLDGVFQFIIERISATKAYAVSVFTGY